jgi:hypothetical protein
MSLESNLLDSKKWLDEHRNEYVSYAVWEGFDAIVGSLETDAESAKELETLVKQAFELLRGEWDPDDVDRHKFMQRLERAIP